MIRDAEERGRDASLHIYIYIYFIYRPREFVHASHFSNYQFFYPPCVYILLARFFPRDRARLNFEDFSKIFTFPSLVRKFNDSLRHPPSWFLSSLLRYNLFLPQGTRFFIYISSIIELGPGRIIDLPPPFFDESCSNRVSIRIVPTPSQV